MKTILVVANETLGGATLLEAIREHAAERRRPRRDLRARRRSPRHGNIIYDEAVYDAAQVRIDLARSVPARARASTRSARSATPTRTRRRWTPSPSTTRTRSSSRPSRRRPRAGCAATSSSASTDAAGVPVEHVVADIDDEGLPFNVTLVVANRTAASAPLLAGARRRRPSRRRPPPVHRRRPPGGRRGPARAQARAGRLAQVRRPPARRRPARRRHDRRPRPLHRDDERAAVLPRRRHRHLDAARRRARAGCAPTSSSACARRPASPSSTSSPRPRPPRGLGDHGSRRHQPTGTPPHARAPRAAARQPQLAGRAPAARDAAFHHLRGDGLRRLLHGLLLHPGRERRPVVPASTATSCRSRWRA